MNESLGSLLQEQRDNLAKELRDKRRERDKIRRLAVVNDENSRDFHNQADQLQSEAKQILQNAKERQPTHIEIINEHTANNPLSDISKNLDLSAHFGVLPFSTEGFAEKPRKQEELARFFINKFGLRQKGALLDVGFGANIHIANTFADEGIDACAIDEQQHDFKDDESLWHAPRIVRKNEKAVEILSGDIADLGEEKSQLKDRSFGLILFNGSWEAGGNNWTVAGEVMEAKYHNVTNKDKTAAEFMDEEKDAILQACRKQLVRNGLIGIVSSRYAFHGAGYGYSQLSDEKLCFIDLYDRFQQLGAKKIYLFGVSQEGFDQMLARSIDQYPKEHEEYKLAQEEIDAVREELRTVANLPDEDIYCEYGDNPEYQKARIRRSKEATSNIAELNTMARVDAIFAEF